MPTINYTPTFRLYALMWHQPVRSPCPPGWNGVSMSVPGIGYQLAGVRTMREAMKMATGAIADHLNELGHRGVADLRATARFAVWASGTHADKEARNLDGRVGVFEVSTDELGRFVVRDCGPATGIGRRPMAQRMVTK